MNILPDFNLREEMKREKENFQREVRRALKLFLLAIACVVVVSIAGSVAFVLLGLQWLGIL